MLWLKTDKHFFCIHSELWVVHDCGLWSAHDTVFTIAVYFLRSGMDYVVRNEWPPGTQCGLLQSKVVEPELQGTSAMVAA